LGIASTNITFRTFLYGDTCTHHHQISSQLQWTKILVTVHKLQSYFNV
jgi:hypothetical protein